MEDLSSHLQWAKNLVSRLCYKETNCCSIPLGFHTQKDKTSMKDRGHIVLGLKYDKKYLIKELNMKIWNILL